MMTFAELTAFSDDIVRALLGPGWMKQDGYELDIHHRQKELHDWQFRPTFVTIGTITRELQPKYVHIVSSSSGSLGGRHDMPKIYCTPCPSPLPSPEKNGEEKKELKKKTRSLPTFGQVSLQLLNL